MKRLPMAAILGAFMISCMVQLANSSSNLTDQSALLAFKTSIEIDPNNVLSNWTKETNFCGWAGVLCSRHRQRVTSLILPSMGLHGTISPHVGNLSFLQELDLRNNSFRGPLTSEIARLSRLRSLVLERNMLQGDIPEGLHLCRRLQDISFTDNRFTGAIPTELSTLPFLRSLLLGGNNLSGIIPPSFGNTSRLQWFGIVLNNIYGNIPTEFAQLPNLEIFSIAANNLTGSIPPALFNKSSMTKIQLSLNAFSGDLPSTTGLWLPNLVFFGLEANQLTGNVPSYLSNCSKLPQLLLSRNLFTGPVPESLGNLKLLLILALSGNRLAGQIPNAFGSLKNLIVLDLADNNFRGNIPLTIGGLERLQRLWLGGNKLRGSIPDEICLLVNLGEIYLGVNELSGSVPSCISDLTRLQVMDLSSNKLNMIPSTLWRLKNLRTLNLSYNSLVGSLDPKIIGLEVLETVDFSWNRISGNIPSTVGTLKSLTSLNLSRNSFSGPIPNSLGKLITLDFLDLSHNNLSGPIPKAFEVLSHLQQLNLSYNMLSGEIPSGGPFTNLTAQSFIENEALCGKPIFQVPACPSHNSRRSTTRTILVRYVLPIALIVFFSSLVYIMKRHRPNNFQSQNLNNSYATIEHRMISYHELRQATNEFCEANLLGVGSHGSVYKGILLDGSIVAIKVLNLQIEDAWRSFDAECTVLRTARHRNVVSIITTCSNLDLRALVLQYMSNGSLEKWLYSHNYCLDLLQRVNIAIDVALALEYLHHYQSEPVVHCDLKPSNVLLDDDMTAHVADFGIAKILAGNKTSTQTKTLGTLGYIAPG